MEIQYDPSAAWDIVLIQRVAGTGLLHPAHYTLHPVSDVEAGMTRLCYQSGRHFAEGFEDMLTAKLNADELARKVGAELRENYDVVEVDSPGLGSLICP